MRVGTWLKGLGNRPKQRTVGNRARDRRNWADAEAGYAAHLAEAPGDAPIWVQYGHALKEQGKLGEALAAYRRAVELRPEDVDAHMHAAHLLKRMGRRRAAAAAFGRVVALGGRREDWDELALLPALEPGDRASLRAARRVEGPMLFLEIGDLLGFLQAHRTVSGIQRVQLGVVRHLMAGTGAAAGLRFALVVNERHDGLLWEIRPEDMAAVSRCLDEDQVDHGRLKRLVRAAYRGSRAVLPAGGPGQTFLVLGAFWNGGAIADRYGDMKRAGVALGVYVYDLIPQLHPEFCAEGLPHEFKLSWGDGLAVFDFVLAISEFTAGEVRDFIAAMGLRERPVVAVPLAHGNDAGGTPAGGGEEEPDGAARRRLRGRPYALMVSTIEVRKNHAFLVAAWTRFVDEGLDPPDLVFVGRLGWRVEGLVEMLETTRFLDGRVHIMHDLSDSELTALYDGALFTLFPSFVEGWGLPVGESLARGVPCVASSTSSIPEVGGELVDYLDPFNLTDGVEVIRRMAFDHAYRDGRAAAIRARFRPRGWDEVCSNLLKGVRRISAELEAGHGADRRPEVLLGAGEVFRPGRYAPGERLPDDYARRPLRSLLARGWGGLRPDGCLLDGRRGELAFRSDLAPGTAVVCYLGLAVEGTADPELELAVGQGADAVRTRLPARLPFGLAVPGRVDGDGVVRLGLALDGPTGARKGDGRFGLILSSLGYQAEGDGAGRLLLAERLLAGAEPQPRAGGFLDGGGTEDGGEEEE